MRIRRITAVVMTALALGLALPAGTAGAATLEQKTFIWRGYQSAGYCTIDPGATWTLYSDGTARLDATVSSLGDEDAWLMWVKLKDSRGRLLDDLRVYGSTSTKFVKNLHDRRSYRWTARGQFDPYLFDLIKGMSLKKHC